MPIKPNNTDKMKDKPATDEKHPLDQPADVERDTGETRYGKGQQAKFNPDADVTQDQEYKKGGLTGTQKYTFDNHTKN